MKRVRIKRGVPPAPAEEKEDRAKITQRDNRVYVNDELVGTIENLRLALFGSGPENADLAYVDLADAETRVAASTNYSYASEAFNDGRRQAIADSFTRRAWEEFGPQIPWINFPPHWTVKVIPPFAGAVVRFLVRRDQTPPTEQVSVYLDCYNALGYMGEPYWEVYPVDDDTLRVPMGEVQELLAAIERGLDTLEELPRIDENEEYDTDYPDTTFEA